MIPKIIFILFVNLRMDSPDNIFLASKELLDYLENELYFLLPSLFFIQLGLEAWGGVKISM